jgi:hypothetical protein
MTNALA